MLARYSELLLNPRSVLVFAFLLLVGLFGLFFALLLLLLLPVLLVFAAAVLLLLLVALDGAARALAAAARLAVLKHVRVQLVAIVLKEKTKKSLKSSLLASTPQK